jgi:hypothetical protein
MLYAVVIPNLSNQEASMLSELKKPEIRNKFEFPKFKSYQSL